MIEEQILIRRGVPGRNARPPGGWGYADQNAVFISPAVVEELKRIVRESEVTKWVRTSLFQLLTGLRKGAK